MWGVPNCGEASPSRTPETGHGAAPAKFRNVHVRGWRQVTGFGSDRLLELAEAALGTGGDDVEALAWRQAGGLTHFAASRIHQSAWREDLWVRVGWQSTATGSARPPPPPTRRRCGPPPGGQSGGQDHAHPDPGYPGMPGPAAYPRAGRHDEATAAAGPATPGRAGRRGHPASPGRGRRRQGLRDPRAGDRPGQHREVRAAGATTAASFSIPGRRRVGHRLGRGTEPALADLDVAALGSGPPRKAVDSRDPRELAPGTYPVVLEPNAASVLVQWLGWLGFGAKAYDEGRSFLVGRLGQQVCSPLVTVVDDATAADTIGRSGSTSRRPRAASP